MKKFCGEIVLSLRHFVNFYLISVLFHRSLFFVNGRENFQLTCFVFHDVALFNIDNI